jgi:mannose-6-phosphate isomerase-like protein (cupin superfamily)
LLEYPYEQAILHRSYREDGLNDPNHGWTLGTFKDDTPRKNEAVEIKYWEFPVGPTSHQLKESSIIECTFILKGKAKASINGEEVMLQAGDYVVIEPGTPSNIPTEVLEAAVGLTIKAPSDPTAKKVLE